MGARPGGARPRSGCSWRRVWPLRSAPEGVPDQGDGGAGPGADRLVQVGELGFGDVEAARGHRGAELDEDGAQVNLDGEEVAGPAAGHHRDRGDAGQAVAAVAVEERLE